MTNSQNSSANSTGIDKQALYGDYRDHRKAQDRLYVRAAHKALDIAEDDMGDINSTKTDNSKHGIGTLGAVAIAAVSGGIPLAGLAAMWLGGVFDKPDVPAPAPVPAVVQPAEPIIKTETKTETKIIDWSVGQPIVE